MVSHGQPWSAMVSHDRPCSARALPAAERFLSLLTASLSKRLLNSALLGCFFGALRRAIRHIVA